MRATCTTGLDARRLSVDDLAWAQNRLRILSGLYGVLRPLDRIQAYRLEMGTRLPTERGDDLYAYWGAEIARGAERGGEGHGRSHRRQPRQRGNTSRRWTATC